MYNFDFDGFFNPYMSYVTLEEWYEESKTRPYFCGVYCMTGCAFSLMVSAIGGLF